MENENNFIEGEKVEDKKTTYETIGTVSVKSKKGEFHFGKQVIVPFVSGVVGAGVVIGTCFGVPSIRESLFNSNKVVVNTNQSNTSSSNTSLISLSNYSETGVAVA